MLRDAPIAGIMYDKSLDPDIRSLRQTVLYGLKGISAYGHQARELGYYSDERMISIFSPWKPSRTTGCRSRN